MQQGERAAIVISVYGSNLIQFVSAGTPLLAKFILFYLLWISQIHYQYPNLRSNEMIWATTRQNVSSGVSDQADLRLCCSHMT